jgi:hypothetical protein
LAASQKVGKKVTAVVKWLKLSPYAPIEVTHYRLKRNAFTLYWVTFPYTLLIFERYFTKVVFLPA